MLFRGSNKGSNLASSARLVADIAVEPSKDPHALYISKVEREQVREAIQQLLVEFREIILSRDLPGSLLFWGARLGQ